MHFYFWFGNGYFDHCVDENEEKPEFCQLPPEKGPCIGQWTRYFYNQTTDDCTVFVYGGCDGNENNFHSLLACRVICQKPKEDPITHLIELPQKEKVCPKCLKLWPKSKRPEISMHSFFGHESSIWFIL